MIKESLNSVAQPRYTVLKGRASSGLLAVCCVLLALLMPLMICGEQGQATTSTALLSDYQQIVYDDASGLPTREANDICQTADGYIWIGSYGGLLRYDGQNFLSMAALAGEEALSVRALYEDSAGRLWIGTNDRGALVYDKGRFTWVRGDVGGSVRAFVQGLDGRMYIASSNGLAVVTKNAVSSMEARSCCATTWIPVPLTIPGIRLRNSGCLR